MNILNTAALESNKRVKNFADEAFGKQLQIFLKLLLTNAFRLSTIYESLEATQTNSAVAKW